MNSENDLIQKLMVSKKIMDRHNQIPRGNSSGIDSSSFSAPMVEQYESPSASYNIPQEFLSETPISRHTSQVPTKDKIINSKLPDEIKRLMLEHPIQQPNNMGGPTLSNDLVEAASRLMKQDKSYPQQTKQQSKSLPTQSFNMSEEIKNVIRETIEDVLKENGLLIESTSKTNEMIRFQVGEHIFEGKVTKIKKVKT
jgi:hypothetical protein